MVLEQELKVTIRILYISLYSFNIYTLTIDTSVYNWSTGLGQENAIRRERIQNSLFSSRTVVTRIRLLQSIIRRRKCVLVDVDCPVKIYTLV